MIRSLRRMILKKGARIAGRPFFIAILTIWTMFLTFFGSKNCQNIPIWEFVAD
jgi:hypothetical protein